MPVAGNDPTRPSDVETDRGVAEFKVGIWSAMAPTSGLSVRLPRPGESGGGHRADTSGRRPELCVGTEPVRFLRISRTTARWALGRGGLLRGGYSLGDSATWALRSRNSLQAANHVRIVDFADLLPEIHAVQS
jgi:hypothetical protein